MNFKSLRGLAGTSRVGGGRGNPAPRADLLRAPREGHALPRRARIEHRWKHASIPASAWTRGAPMTAHPGIGHDIVVCNPAFDGAVLGRAAAAGEPPKTRTRPTTCGSARVARAWAAQCDASGATTPPFFLHNLLAELERA